MPFRLYPVEEVTLAALGLMGALYLYFDVPLRMPGQMYLLKVISGTLMYAVGLLLVAPLLLRLRHIAEMRRTAAPLGWRHTTAEFRARFLETHLLWRDFRHVHAIGALMLAFVHLKHLIPRMNSAVHDAAVAGFERLLAGGVSPSERLLSLLGPEQAPLWSEVYTLFYPYMGFISVVFILQRRLRLGEQFCAAFALLWLLGVLAEYAYPTWGPCFSSPDLFAGLPRTEMTDIQQMLWKNKLFVDQNPHSTVGLFLISGVPSLHMAVLFLGSWYLQRIAPPVALLSWLFTAATFVSTIYFGWHFVLDAVAAVPLTALALVLARRIAPTDEAPD